MTALLSPSPIQKFFDNAGLPLSFGFVSTYQAGTNTPQATFVDSTQTTQNTNPIKLNARGEAQIWLDPTKAYKFLITDIFGNTIPGWPVDNIVAPGAIGGTNYVIDTGIANAYVASYAAISALSAGVVVAVKITNTNTGASTLNLNSLGAAPIILESGQTLSGGELVAGGIYQFQYDGANWQTIGPWLDPTRQRTPAESAAGVTPVNYYMPPGAIERCYSGSGDARAAIQAALNSNKIVYSFYGTQTAFNVSDYLLVPAGVTLRDCSFTATGNVSNYATYGANHQGQLVILAGNGASARNVIVNGANFKAGGFNAVGTYGNDVVGCTIRQTISAVADTTQGILHVTATDFRIEGNHLEYCGHGIQLGQAARGTVVGNTCQVIAHGGIWTSDADRIAITGNTVTDCGDVGIDMEGGVDCIAAGNAVYGCNNAELSLFQNGTGSGRVPRNLVFSSNTVVRTTQYRSGINSGAVSLLSTANAAQNGGIAIFSITSGQTGIVISDNTVYATGRKALATADNGAVSWNGQIIGNTFLSDSTIFVIQRNYGLIVKGNTFWGLSGSEAQENQYKDCAGGRFEDNTFRYDATKTTNYALHYITTAGIANNGPRIVNNKFQGTAAFAFQHDCFGGSDSAYVSGNMFSDGFVSNGGVDSTSVAYPLYRDQMLLLTTGSALDLSTINALKGAANFCNGQMIVLGGGTAGATYQFVYASTGTTLASRDGSGSGTGVPTSTTRYATFAGSTITITAPATAIGNITLKANTGF